MPIYNHESTALAVQIKDPSYIIVAGLVFTPLSIPFLRSEFGEDWEAEAPIEIVHRAEQQRSRARGEQLVILSQVLADDLMVGYEDITNALLMSVNGVDVQNLEQLKGLVEHCEDAFLRFLLNRNRHGGGERLVMRTEEARSATERVLKAHGIPAAMSADLGGPPVEGGAECGETGEGPAEPAGQGKGA